MPKRRLLRSGHRPPSQPRTAWRLLEERAPAASSAANYGQRSVEGSVARAGGSRFTGLMAIASTDEPRETIRDLVVPLVRLRSTDVNYAGGKGANLGELLAVGASPAVLARDQPAAQRVADQLRPRRKAQLLLDVGPVCLHRPDGQIQLFGDLRIRVAKRDQAQHVDLA